MKAVMKLLWMVAVISVLAGCGSTNEESTLAERNEPEEKDTAEAKENTSKDEGEEADMTNGNDISPEENKAVEPDSATSEVGNQQNEDALSQYSSNQPLVSYPN